MPRLLRSLLLALLFVLPTSAFAESHADDDDSAPAAEVEVEAAPEGDSAAPEGDSAPDDDDSAATAEPAAPAEAAAEADDDDSAAAVAAATEEEEEGSPLIKSAKEFLPILILLAVIALSISRLPKVKEVGHSDAYRKRRVMNWVPLGLTYAFLYMGRYNLTVSKHEFDKLGLMDNADFGVIFGIGTLVYGCAFLINGPIADRWGGRRAILIGAAGALVMNVLLGLVALEVVTSGGSPGPIADAANAVGGPFFAAFTWFRGLFGLAAGNTETSPLLPALSLLFAGNMYFQSFGAVAIVKCNAPWFHVRERGVFGAIFGILISLGIYFAYDWNGLLLDYFPGRAHLVFFVPAALLAVCFVVTYILARNTPGEAGMEDFDTGDATSGETGPSDPPVQVFLRMLRNPVIMTIAAIEFCSGFVRQGIMQWGKIFPKDTGLDSFVADNWGIMLCCAGILGGMFAGVISDHVFNSRRGPVAAVLYGMMIVGSIGMAFLLESWMVMWLLVFMSLCVIGVHGMLSGTASMDFGGAKNAGIAVGLIDGFVYLGTALMSFWYGWRLPKGEEAKLAENWTEWPLWLIPIAVIGFFLATRVWNAKPKAKGGH